MSVPETSGASVYSRSDPTCCASMYAAVPGRVLLSTIFLLSGFGKVTTFGGTVAYAASAGVPAPKLMIAIAAAAELIGGLSLLLGAFARIGAGGLFLFLIPTTIVFHNFWAAPDAQAHLQQFVHFLKNLAIMGGLLMVVAAGPGPLSVDAARRRR